MPYTGFYRQMPYVPIPAGSRTTAYIYPGAVCPQRCNFGYTHGTSPARATIQCDADVIIPLGQNLMIQVGQSTFYGIVVRGQRDFSVERSTGSATTFYAVDWRDRLHDIHHFAQYNMGDEKGRRWHILPKFWSTQQRTFITTVQDVTDILEEQKLEDLLEGFDLNNYDQCPPLFSVYSILAYLAITYQFTFTYTNAAYNSLITTYPVDLDWNSGRRVIDCIDNILTQANLQFTAWGNLNLHITRRGYPETPFEQALQAGAINLCNLRGQKDSSLGAELNEKGRRVTIMGGPNKYEYWYPCQPDWNPRFTWDMVNDIGGQFSALLVKYGVTRFDRLDKLPYRWQDRRNFNGKKRNEMTIEDYINQIPFKVYRVDFGWPLEKPFPWEQDIASTDLEDLPAFDPEFMFLMWNYQDFVNEVAGGDVGFFTDPDSPLLLRMLWGEYLEHEARRTGLHPDLREWREGGTYQHRAFKWSVYNDMWTNPIYFDSTKRRSWHYLDSAYPISSHMITDSNRQFLAMATSRATHVKGNRTKDEFLKGVFTFITDGVSLDVEEYVVPQNYQTNMRDTTKDNMFAHQVGLGNQDETTWDAFGEEPAPGNIRFNAQEYPDQFSCRQRYAARIVFSEMKFTARVEEEFVAADEEKGIPEHQIEKFIAGPDRVFVKLSQDREFYRYVMGEDQGGMRVREIIQHVPDLYYPIVEFVQRAVIRNPESFTHVPPEKQLLTASNLYVNEVAQQLAYRALNHEWITSAGYIKFQGNAGYYPSGMIDNVSVDFNSSGGTNSGGTVESVNFTNLRNDERQFRIVKAETKFKILGEQEMRRESIVAMMREALKDMQNGIGANKPNKEGMKAADNNQVNIEKGFGKDGVANIKFEVSKIPDGDTPGETLAPGHLIIVKGPSGP